MSKITLIENTTIPDTPDAGELHLYAKTDGALYSKNDAGLEVLLATIPVPSGTLWMYAGVTAPSGWLIANGSAVSRTNYAALFAVVGTTYGTGDGLSTFNLPDLQGRVPIGAGQGSGLTNRTLSTKLGAETHQLSVAELASHNHTIRVHGGNDVNFSASPIVLGGDDGPGGSAIAINNPISSIGSNSPHNNMQPSIVLNFIIKT
jgi:microcystin-dependent protein